MNNSVRVVPFRTQLADAFRLINEEWIQSMFELEASDRVLLEKPQESILDHGGHIWFAEHQELGIIGTCALFRRGESVFELTKMGVLQSARGLKAGEILLAHVLEQAKLLNLGSIFLLTSSQCEAAIHLYYKYGFVDDAQILEEYALSYQRCEIAMRWQG